MKLQQVRVVAELGERVIDREKLVVAYIGGEVPVPDDLMVLVKRYRDYAATRLECVSFPREEDEEMNRVYDALVALA